MQHNVWDTVTHGKVLSVYVMGFMKLLSYCPGSMLEYGLPTGQPGIILGFSINGRRKA